METFQIFAVSVIGLLVWGFILSAIISGATKIKIIERQLRIQTALLAKIAKQGGASQEEITYVTKEPTKSLMD